MRKLDLANQNQDYWEDALEYSMARGGRGDPRHHAAVIAYLESQQINDLEAEDLEGFDIFDIFFADQSQTFNLQQSEPGNKDFRILRTKFDSDDQFMRGHAEGSGIHAARTYQMPEFFNNDAQLKAFLKHMFPLANTIDRKCSCERCVFPNGKTGKHPRSAKGCDCKNCKQTMMLGTWLVVIRRWFQEHLSDTVVETQYKWEPGSVGSLVQKIRKAGAKYEQDMLLTTNNLAKELEESDNASASFEEEEGQEIASSPVEMSLSS